MELGLPSWLTKVSLVVYQSLLIEQFLFYLILEPTIPTVDIRRSLFEAHTERVQLSDEQKRKHAYDGLKDFLPESSFVIMAKAEFGSEELEEVIVEMAEDPVLADITQKQLTLQILKLLKRQLLDNQAMKTGNCIEKEK